MILAYHLAKNNLRAHKLRSFLTVIGIIVSVFVLSLIFIIEDSVLSNINNQLRSLSKNDLIINGQGNKFNMLGLMNTPNNSLSNYDTSAISKIVKSSVNSSLFLSGNASFDKNQLDNINIIATNSNFKDFNPVKMLSGDWFSEEETSYNWVILGKNLASKLIGSERARNQIINLKGVKFTVIGIAESKNLSNNAFFDINNSAFIGLKSGQNLAKTDKIGQINVRINNDNKDTKNRIYNILKNNHKDSSDYNIINAKDYLNNTTKSLKNMKLLVVLFVVTTLVISGIAIMNIMLVGVVERRHEIGIRKAVGATNNNIRNQFILESIILTTRGGLIGFALAYLVGLIISFYLSINLCFSLNALLIGLAIPILIGIFFGVYPAVKAARGNIIDALNQLT